MMAIGSLLLLGAWLHVAQDHRSWKEPDVTREHSATCGAGAAIVRIP
jgi:hypothetical protein